MQLTPDTIYTLSTDGVPIRVIKGTKNGRIFLGGKDGNLYELVYRVRKTNLNIFFNLVTIKIVLCGNEMLLKLVYC